MGFNSGFKGLNRIVHLLVMIEFVTPFKMHGMSNMKVKASIFRIKKITKSVVTDKFFSSPAKCPCWHY